MIPMTKTDLEAAGFKVSSDYADTMDIHTPTGSLVPFHGKGGHKFEQEAAKPVFTVGSKHEVEEIRIGDWTSTVRVRDVDGWFNTCLFGPAE